MQCTECGHSITKKNSSASCLYCGAGRGGLKQPTGRIPSPGAGKRAKFLAEKISGKKGLSEDSTVNLNELPSGLRKQVLHALQDEKGTGDSPDAGTAGFISGVSLNSDSAPAVGTLPGFEGGRKFSETDIDLYLDQLRNQRKRMSKSSTRLIFFLVTIGISLGCSLLYL